MRSVFVLGVLVCCAAHAERDSFGLGNGMSGALVVPNAVVQVGNTAKALVTDAVRGVTTLTVDGDATVFLAPDHSLVMLHQTQVSSGAPDAGDQTTVSLVSSNLGAWEFARVSAVSASGVITLTAPLEATFTAPGAQVLVVPEFTSVTVNVGGTLTTAAWGGAPGHEVGGLLVFLCQGPVTLASASLDAHGLGFRGGASSNFAACRAQPGEGPISGVFTAASGTQNRSMGGGAGSCTGSGAAGGGHWSSGGAGGLEGDAGSLGGAGVSYFGADTRLLLGGGGGAAHGNGSNQPGVGGRGGGVMFFRAASLTSSVTASIHAYGGPGGYSIGDAGAGGGGAGGTVVIRLTGALNAGYVDAFGGPGASGAKSEAAGGGGAGGRAFFQAGGGLNLGQTNVTGGAGGSSGVGSDTAGGPGQVVTVPSAFPVLPAPILLAPDAGAGRAAARRHWRWPAQHVGVDSRRLRRGRGRRHRR